jgi:hypothetical protein
MEPIFLVVLLKPALYTAYLFAVTRLWATTPPASRWAPVGAGVSRAVLGIVVGVPVGLLLRSAWAPSSTMEMLAFTAVFDLFRLGLWALVVKGFFPRLSWGRVAAVALVGVGLNALLDVFALDHSVGDELRIGFC